MRAKPIKKRNPPYKYYEEGEARFKGQYLGRVKDDKMEIRYNDSTSVFGWFQLSSLSKDCVEITEQQARRDYPHCFT